MTAFTAFWVEKTDDGMKHSVISRSTDDLPEGELLIRVAFSSVNYKDALSAQGNPGVTRNYPHTPGIDAVGVVVESAVEHFQAGDEVIVIGFDLGMDTAGGFGEFIRVPASWATPLPAGLSARESMILGTAGFTAALSVEKLERLGAAPEDGAVLVTGATGGVGSVAVALLAKLGFEVVASSGKPDKADYLTSLGATSIIDRNTLSEDTDRPLLRETYAHAVDTVGGPTLVNVLKSLKYGGSVAASGLVQSPQLAATVFPFILRGVNLLGIDSVQLPIEKKSAVWQRLASEWKLPTLETMVTEVTLDRLSDTLNALLKGQSAGRSLVVHDG